MGIRVRCGARTASVFETDQPEQQQQQRKMIGVKRPLKLGTPKPPKSAKKKKLLKTTQPLPDPDDATVIANPHAEFMVQKPSDLMEEMALPLTQVVEESVNCTPLDVEPCEKLPPKMRYRYRTLLGQSNPQKDGDKPSLAYLEDKYGHMVEKQFWYNRVVKLANAYRDNKGGDVSDLSHSALEEAVGQLVPLTTQEQERLHAEATPMPHCEFGPPFDGLYEEDSQMPVIDVLEEGEIPSAQEMVQHLLTDQKVMEFPNQLPHLMGFRYKMLLEKCHPKELIEPPSLTWLEERYGHLVEKEFWYDRTVQLARTYLETCEDDVFDKTLGDLEQAVGHLVPYTEVEKEYLQLMENYKKSRLKIDGRPSLEYLRKHHSKPPTVREHARVYVDQAEQIPASPEYLPSVSEECPDTAPHRMGVRYNLLLDKCRPSELIPGQPPSLTWLEERYGELVPYTAAETEYQRLLENYKKNIWQYQGKPLAPPSSPEYLPSFSEEEDAEAEATEEGRRYVPEAYCPIHEESKMTCLNADEVYGALLFKCTKPGCSVFYTSATSEDVRYQLREAIHPTVHQGLLHTDLKCHCEYTPRMKLSQSQKNLGRVFLTCFKKTNPCPYFQWVHWKVRPPQGPMDAFVQPRAELDPFVQKPYTRPVAKPPQGPNQLVATGVERFKKDRVKMYPPLPSEWGTPNPWRQPDTVESVWGKKPTGFVPSSGPGVGHEFRNGLYIGDQSFERDFFGPRSSNVGSVLF